MHSIETLSEMAVLAFPYCPDNLFHPCLGQPLVMIDVLFMLYFQAQSCLRF